MKPFRVKYSQTNKYDLYDIIELYKANLIDKNEARYLAAEFMDTGMFFEKKPND